MGTIVAGWLSDRLQQRKPLIIAGGAINVVLYNLLGHAPTIWHFAILIAIAWFLGGMAMVLIYTIAGLFTAPTERGIIFGILALTDGIGAIIGGILTGRIADTFGYTTLFSFLAMIAAILPLSGLILKDNVTRSKQTQVSKGRSKSGIPSKLGMAFFILLIANILVELVSYMGSFGRSLAMNELGFTVTAISSTVAIGGAVSLPFRPLLEELSDKFGRPRLLALCYLSTAIALYILATATSLVMFWVSISFLFASNIRSAVGSALVTDLTPQDTLGAGMSLFRSTSWIGGTIGFSISGYFIQQIGRTLTFCFAATFPFISIVLVYFIRHLGLKREE